MIARDEVARVVAVVARPFPYYTIELEVPEAYAAAEPGHFVMIETRRGLEPYLRRAFSVHDVSRAAEGVRIELLAKIVGRGTAALAAARPGDRLAILGPLGRPFGRPEAGPIALVAGGVGSAPLLLDARRLLERNVRFDLFYGGRGAVDLPRLDELGALAERSGGVVVATTEDGSAGTRGLVIEPLAARLANERYEALHACGPMGLLARLATLAAEHGVPAEGALETEMGCGFGACLGCAVPHVEGRYALCCKDGPVFALDEVRW
ncbi:MAG: dihydroorotate dehydrogenase electron transfer subunit [Holophagales bacterium]|nr:dihydroorotate dehydrogenase electron transfer subunit [Holophagales bacterium]